MSIIASYDAARNIFQALVGGVGRSVPRGAARGAGRAIQVDIFNTLIESA